MIQSLKLTALAAAIALSMTGCVSINNSSFYGGSVLGKGPLVEQTYPVTGYDAVEITGGFVVVYSNAPSDVVRIDIQENLLKYLNVSVEGEKLIIESSRSFSTKQNHSPTIYLSTPHLKKLDVAGAIDLEQADTIQGDSFTLDVSGACSVKLDLEVQRLETITSGASALELSGTATDASFDIAGVGTFEAFGLQTKTAVVEIGGVGSGTISCSDELTVDIGGMGALEYKGNPRVVQHGTMMGAVTKVG